MRPAGNRNHRTRSVGPAIDRPEARLSDEAGRARAYLEWRDTDGRLWQCLLMKSVPLWVGRNPHIFIPPPSGDPAARRAGAPAASAPRDRADSPGCQAGSGRRAGGPFRRRFAAAAVDGDSHASSRRLNSHPNSGGLFPPAISSLRRPIPGRGGHWGRCASYGVAAQPGLRPGPRCIRLRPQRALRTGRGIGRCPAALVHRRRLTPGGVRRGWAPCALSVSLSQSLSLSLSICREDRVGAESLGGCGILWVDVGSGCEWMQWVDAESGLLADATDLE
jgi:hypothetical protein